MSAGAPSRIRVVIAEDHDSVRNEIRRLLAGCDEFEVTGEARNGAEAVALARALRPDVVLIDARMPVMNGLEATRRIHAEAPDIAVVGMSSRAWAGAPHAFEQAGVAGYFEKGDPPAVLIATVSAAARIRRGR